MSLPLLLICNARQQTCCNLRTLAAPEKYLASKISYTQFLAMPRCCTQRLRMLWPSGTMLCRLLIIAQLLQLSMPTAQATCTAPFTLTISTEPGFCFAKLPNNTTWSRSQSLCRRQHRRATLAQFANNASYEDSAAELGMASGDILWDNGMLGSDGTCSRCSLLAVLGEQALMSCACASCPPPFALLLC